MKEKKEENIIIDTEEVNRQEMIPVEKKQVEKPIRRNEVYSTSEVEENLVNCLRNETVIVRFIAKARGPITDPKHVLYGNMHPKAEYNFTTPLLRSGGFVDVLTKQEKNYLEHVMGVEPNALSVHNRNNNFWDDSNINGIGRITLKKGDNRFNLADPMDYIRVKVLMANKDEIASSLQEMQDRPKATHRFVIIRENDTHKDATLNVTMKSKAYMEFGSMRNDADKMRTVIEIFQGSPVSQKSSIDFLQGEIGKLIESNTKLFLNIVTDSYLDNKILLKKAVEKGIISNRGGFLYFKEGNMPLCNNGEDPTLSVAAKYISLPKNQELKFKIEAQIK